MTIDDGAGLKAARKELELSVYELGELLRLQGGRDAAGDFVRAIEEGRKPLSGPIAVAVELLVMVRDRPRAPYPYEEPEHWEIGGRRL